MSVLIDVDPNVFRNKDTRYKSKSLVNTVLSEISDVLTANNVTEDVLPRLSVIVATGAPHYSHEQCALIASKEYFDGIEESIRAEGENTAKGLLQFELGRIYGKHIFHSFTGYEGIDEFNETQYKEFSNIFSKFFRDYIFPRNIFVKANEKDFDGIEDLTRYRLTKMFSRDKMPKTFQSLKDYFFEHYLTDSNPDNIQT